MFIHNEECCVVSSSDILSWLWRCFQLLLQRDQNANEGYENQTDSAKHGRSFGRVPGVY